MKITNKKIALVLILVAGSAVIGYALFRGQTGDDNNFGSKDKIGKTYLRSGYGDGNFLYSCSKEIEVVYQGSSFGPGAVYRPVNQEEATKYCRSNAAIEYHAIIDVLKKPDVAKTIETYNTSQAWVKALNASYIKDKDYMHRILPDYKDMKIHCVIVVHSPEGTRYFLEDGDKDHEYVEVKSEVFLASLNLASDEDVTSFWLGLH